MSCIHNSIIKYNQAYNKHIAPKGISTLINGMNPQLRQRALCQMTIRHHIEMRASAIEGVQVAGIRKRIISGYLERIRSCYSSAIQDYATSASFRC